MGPCAGLINPISTGKVPPNNHKCPVILRFGAYIYPSKLLRNLRFSLQNGAKNTPGMFKFPIRLHDHQANGFLAFKSSQSMVKTKNNISNRNIYIYIT